MFPKVRSGPSPSIPVRTTRSSAKDTGHARLRPIHAAREAIAHLGAAAHSKVRKLDKLTPTARQPLAKCPKKAPVNNLAPISSKPLEERKEAAKALPFPNEITLGELSAQIHAIHKQNALDSHARWVINALAESTTEDSALKYLQDLIHLFNAMKKEFLSTHNALKMVASFDSKTFVKYGVGSVFIERVKIQIIRNHSYQKAPGTGAKN